MNTKFGLWRLGAVLLAAASAAGAQPAARSYAVISEIAREVSVVSFQESTGTNLIRNQRQPIPVPDDALDKVALLTTQQALQAAAPGAKVWLLAPSDTNFFEWQQNIAEKGVLRLPADLAAALKENKSTHLLLFTRFRAPAQFHFRDWTSGTGTVDGLGFYVDRQTRVIDFEKSARSGVGFLAPFAYFRLTLLDSSTGQVLKTEIARVSEIYTPGEGKDGSVNPWEALTSSEKMKRLAEILRSEVARLVPLMMAGP